MEHEGEMKLDKSAPTRIYEADDERGWEMDCSEDVPYVAIGNGEPVPPQLKPIMEKLNASQEVPIVRDDPEIGREQE
jgi:hypothetical protein